MKRILFLLTMILIGVNVSFASNKKEKKNAENMVLYEKAVKAMEDNKFVIKFHTMDGSRRRIRLDELTNWFILDENSVKLQNDDGRRWYRARKGGHLDFPDIYEGKALNNKIDVDKKGNVTCFVSSSCKGERIILDIDLKITFKQGTNECKVTIKRKGRPTTYLYGTVHPIGATEIRKAV